MRKTTGIGLAFVMIGATAIGAYDVSHEDHLNLRRMVDRVAEVVTPGGSSGGGMKVPRLTGTVERVQGGLLDSID